jgi:hypothetical protein
MEKLKVDVLIKGDLICKQILTGGKNQTESFTDNS